MRGAAYFGKQVKQSGQPSTLHAVFVSGYVLSFTDNVLKDVRSNVGTAYAYYDEGAYRNERKNGDMRRAPEALRLVNSGLEPGAAPVEEVRRGSTTAIRRRARCGWSTTSASSIRSSLTTWRQPPTSSITGTGVRTEERPVEPEPGLVLERTARAHRDRGGPHVPGTAGATSVDASDLSGPGSPPSPAPAETSGLGALRLVGLVDDGRACCRLHVHPALGTVAAAVRCGVQSRTDLVLPAAHEQRGDAVGGAERSGGLPALLRGLPATRKEAGRQARCLGRGTRLSELVRTCSLAAALCLAYYALLFTIYYFLHVDYRFLFMGVRRFQPQMIALLGMYLPSSSCSSFPTRSG